MEINADDSNCSVRAALRTREKIRALVYFHDDNKSYVIKNLRPHIPENATWNTRDTYLVDWAKIKKEESGATIGSPSQFCQMIIVLAAGNSLFSSLFHSHWLAVLRFITFISAISRATGASLFGAPGGA